MSPPSATAPDRPGPATWEFGQLTRMARRNLPCRRDQLVRGVLPMPNFAGKRLPTIYHWDRGASGVDAVFSDMLRLSQFDSRGVRPSGRLPPGGGAHSAPVDMAGNIKEWCANAAVGHKSFRYILGGGWNEPHYRYMEEDAHSPWSRRPTFGCTRDGNAAGRPPRRPARQPVSLAIRRVSCRFPTSCSRSTAASTRMTARR